MNYTKFFIPTLVAVFLLAALTIVPGFAEDKVDEPKYSSDKRFIDNGDGTISDTKTDLMWMKDDSYQHKKHWLNWFQVRE